MATATRIQGKTSFVKEFIRDNPQANAKAVNEAWTAAGFEGTISHPVISEVRKQLGLTGKEPGKPRRAARGKAVSNSPKTASTRGKTFFVKEFLHDHPQANAKAVNEAWTAAGLEGTISRTLVDKTRALLGLTGNQRGKSKKPRTSAAGTKRERRPKETTGAFNGLSPGNRTTALEDIEGEIDRILFKVMGIGDLAEIEDSLRRARRLLYGALTRR